MKKIGAYPKKVIEYFKNPRNCGRMKNPDGVGKVVNPVCEDVMWLYLKVGRDKKKKEIIKEIKFETLGCVFAIASGSTITDLAKGKTLEEAMEIDGKQIIKSLGELPPAKIHCSILAARALSEAIYDYLLKNKKEIPKKLLEVHRKIEKAKETKSGQN